MDVVALVLGAVLAVFCVVYVARPFVSEPGVSEDNDRLVSLDAAGDAMVASAEDRDRALAALKELEFDHRTGKITDEDYRALVVPLRAEAARAMKALE